MDYRHEILKRFETNLVTNMETETVRDISNALLVILDDYEVTTRCTEIAVVDSPNESLLKTYSASLLLEGKSEKTVNQYIRTCKKLSDFLNKPLVDTGAYDIKTFLALEKSRGIKNTTLENTRSNISAFFTWLADEEFIEKDPSRSVKPIKCTKEVKKAFSDVELEKLRNHCLTEKERALVEFLITSGARLSEVIEADIKDVDFKNLSFHIKHGKGDKERITYITEVTAMHLKKYLKSRSDESSVLFATSVGRKYSPNGMRKILNQIADRAQVEDVHPHRFRRTFATDLAKRGMDIQEIKTLMGHSDINTTLIYVQISDEKVKDSYRRYA